MNVQLATGEQALVRLRRIEQTERRTSNVQHRTMMSLHSSNYSKIEWKTNTLCPTRLVIITYRILIRYCI